MQEGNYLGLMHNKKENCFFSVSSFLLVLLLLPPPWDIMNNTGREGCQLGYGDNMVRRNQCDPDRQKMLTPLDILRVYLANLFGKIFNLLFTYFGANFLC